MKKDINISKILKKQGKSKNIDDSTYDAEELRKGIKIEYEHIDKEKYSNSEAKNIAKEIAKDHLEEIPDYYTRLIKMEKEAESEKEVKESISLKEFLENNEESMDDESDYFVKKEDRERKSLPEDIEKKVIAFLKKNPNPDDDKVHAFAKKMGIEPDLLEPVFYKLATKGAK